jgi:outer membrane protein TolC
LVVANNPELKALQAEYEAELMKVDQVRSIPNTQLGVGVPILRPETRLGPQMMMVSASQMFPWFGTRKAKEDVVISMSKAKYERITAIRLELFNKVEIAYYELLDLQRKEAIVKKVLKQLHAIEQSALAKLEGGSGSMANVLRAQLKMDELEQQLERIEALKAKQSITINSLTFTPWTTEIIVQDEEPILFDFNLEEFQLKIQEHNPLVTMIDEQIAASKNRQLVNKKMGSPMIGAGLDYSLVGHRTDLDPMYNGRDILISQLMISIPLHRKEFTAKNQEEELIQASLEFKREGIEQRVVGYLLQYHEDYKLALLDVDLVGKQVENTKKIIELLTIEYSTDGIRFDELLQVHNELLIHEMELSKAQKMANVAVSNMERLINY